MKQDHSQVGDRSINKQRKDDKSRGSYETILGKSQGSWIGTMTMSRTTNEQSFTCSFIGSLQIGHNAAKEEGSMDQHLDKKVSVDPSRLSSVLGRNHNVFYDLGI